MEEKKPALKTIWYFVGLILIVMGGLVLLSGLIQLISPSQQQTVLAETYPAIWWGGLMLVTGLIYFISNKNKVVE
ncbi:MAG: hypothetical protein KAJ16_12340 [Calditrichia bacterium]|nr:hypothetical protein [Calditrichia bacterium]